MKFLKISVSRVPKVGANNINTKSYTKRKQDIMIENNEMNYN